MFRRLLRRDRPNDRNLGGGNQGITTFNVASEQDLFTQDMGNGPRSTPSLNVTPLVAVMRTGKAVLKILGVITGVSMDHLLDTAEDSRCTATSVTDYGRKLMKTIVSLLDEQGFQNALKYKLEELSSELHRILAQVDSRDDPEIIGGEIMSKLESFMFVNHMVRLITMADPSTNMKEHALIQAIRDLPRAEAAFDDYASKKLSGPCFQGTREALLTEMAEWIIGKYGIYVLSGLAGIGKSTVAYTVAERAHSCGYLGASFFFSRDELDRKTAKKVFTTIAFQLCVYDEEFASAIGRVLLSNRGSAVASKGPHEQLEVLILDPLHDLVKLRRRPIVIVVDALDECEDRDAPSALLALNRLVQALPVFKVILTARPQPHLRLLLDSSNTHTVFHLHNIEDKIVDRDVRLYLEHNLSQTEVSRRLPSLSRPWGASDEEIASLVRATGRLFIIASTSVVFILDKTACNPRSQMAKLLSAFAQDRTPFNVLNEFYTVVLRSAVPVGSDRDIVERFRVVVGTIILVQEPLSVTALATLVNIEVDDVYAVLGNLQAVILLNNNVTPLIYHKSFLDYITDPERCKDEDLRIIPQNHHIIIAIRCLKVMNQCLKQNMLELDGPARFFANCDVLANQRTGTAGERPRMKILPEPLLGGGSSDGDNDDDLLTEGIREDEVEARIPSELRYACIHWTSHIDGEDIEHIGLLPELEEFANEHLLHWFEALSWAGKLDSAHRALRTVLDVMKFDSTDLRDLISDALRFISKFYNVIEKSALHIYCSALPFSPKETTLYKKYQTQMLFCRVEGAPEKWEALVATTDHGEAINMLAFSSDNTMFASRGDQMLKLWDAVTSTPMGTIMGDSLAIASDFTTAASSNGSNITLYNAKKAAPVATIAAPRRVQMLSLSPNGLRLAGGVEGSTMNLWDIEEGRLRLIAVGDGWAKDTPLMFSPSGTRLAYGSAGGIKLLDGTDGKVLADLNCQFQAPTALVFSHNDSRIACLAKDWRWTLRLWDGGTGELIGAVEDVGWTLAISADGSLLVTGRDEVKIWGGDVRNKLPLLETLTMDGWQGIHSLEISRENILAVVCIHSSTVTFYDIRSRLIIAKLPSLSSPIAIAFSSDCKRFVAGSISDAIQLWDIPSVRTSGNTYRGQSHLAATCIKFSPDCSRLAAGFKDGTIKLWDTCSTRQLITTLDGHFRKPITSLAFSISGLTLVSASEDGAIRIWDGRDGTLIGLTDVLECVGEPTALALTATVLAAATDDDVTLWDLNSFSSLMIPVQHSTRMSLSCDEFLLAAFNKRDREITLWDVKKQLRLARFETHEPIKGMTFSSDNHHLSFHLATGVIGSFSIADKMVTSVLRAQYGQHRLIPCWDGIPVWVEIDKHYQECNMLGLVHGPQSVVSVALAPRDFDVVQMAQGSSMLALGCFDGRVIIIKSLHN